MYLIFLRMLALTFLLPISTTLARVANRVDAPAEPLVAARIASKQGSLFSHLRNVFFKRDEICVKDDFYYYLQSNPEANTFCNIWISIPPATTMVEYTSTITATDITTTSTNTVVNTVWTTTVFTVTATETVAIGAKEKREDAPAPTDTPLLRRNVLLNSIAAVVTDAIGGTVASSADMPAGTAKASIDAGLSSACSCLNYQPLSTFTVTYTDLPYYTTLDAFEQDTLTLQSTIIQTSYTTQTTTQTTTIGLTSSISLTPSSSPLNSIASAATYVPTPLNNTASTSSVLISSSSLTAAASSTASIVTSITVTGGPDRPSSEARAIALSPSTAASAVSSNGTAASMNETALISTSIVSGGVSGVMSGNTIVINSTGGVGVISPTSSQSTTYTPTPVNGATASLNKTISVTSIFISGITTVLSVTSESEIQPLPSGSPSVIFNLTIASPEITTLSGTAPPSMTPAPSANTSTSSFTFSDHPDSRGYSPGLDSSSAFNYTSIVGTRVIVSTVTPSGTAFSPSRSSSIIASTGTPVVLNGTTSSEARLTTFPGSNSIFIASTGIASLIVSSESLSLTLASISGNETTAFPTAPNSSSFTFSNGGDSRIRVPSPTETPTPTPFANSTTQVGSDSISILPSTSISIPNPNSTMPLGSGPVSALPSTPLPTLFANSITPINTGSVIILSSNSGPTPSANFTPLSSSGSAPILLSTPGLMASANSTMPLGSGSALTIPSTSIYAASLNSTTLLGTGSTESASAPSLFENSTAVFGSGSIPTILSISISPFSANSTASSGTGSTIAATPNPLPSSAMSSSSRNISINVNSILSPSSSLITGVATSAPPSSTSTVLSNATSSSECGGSATLSIETVFITHTVPASTCSLTGGFSSQTHGPVSMGNPSTNSSTWSEYRFIGEVATQAQINAACANGGNLIFNGDFEMVDGNNNAIGWDSYSRSSFIDFEDYPSTTQHTPGGSYNGRVVNMDPGASISIWQPVTLCPNGSYYLEAWDRQYPLLAECVVSYALGNQTVFSTSPQEAWGAQKVIYTAGETAAAVSMTFNITVTCPGQSGKLSEDVNREMIAEIDDLSLIAL